MKILGREAGEKCIVVDVVDKNFVLVTGPKGFSNVRRRRANIRHLEPMEMLVDIKRGATDAEVLEALKKVDLLKEPPIQTKSK